MKATQKLHDLGQSFWLHNITGLTSNPTIFEHAIAKSTAYDAAIRTKHEGFRADWRCVQELRPEA